MSPNLILRTKHEITFNISSLHKCSNYFNFLNPPLNDAPSSLFPAAAPHSSPGCRCLMIFYMKSLPPPWAVMSAHVNLPTLIELDLKSHLSNSTLLTNPFYILKFKIDAYLEREIKLFSLVTRRSILCSDSVTKYERES